MQETDRIIVVRVITVIIPAEVRTVDSADSRDREVRDMQETDRDRLTDRMARVTPMEAAAEAITEIHRVARVVSAVRVVRDLLVVTTALIKEMEQRTLALEENLREDLQPSYRRLRSRIRRNIATKKNAVSRKIRRTKKI